MKKGIWFLLVLSFGLFSASCQQNVSREPNSDNQTASQIEAQNKAEITDLVQGFGQQLQKVSLLATEEIVKKSMQESYGDYVSPELLAQWQADSLHAPGRLTSSPWPDRIEVQSIEKTTEGNYYQVIGEIVEITSTEVPGVGTAARRAVTLSVQKQEKDWVIIDVILGAYSEKAPIVYQNTQYGFSFALPAGWEGYTALVATWEGRAIDGASSGQIVETGPLLSLRHPSWTKENPRQDIPILIFTQAQWLLVEQEKISLGAAPIGPSELGRNDTYVFALPARYNYAFPEGFEEVETILANHPLQAIAIS